MSELQYRVTGPNAQQVRAELQTMRGRSPTFRALEEAILAKGVQTIVIHESPHQGDVGQVKPKMFSDSPSEETIQLNSAKSGYWGARRLSLGKSLPMNWLTSPYLPTSKSVED